MKLFNWFKPKPAEVPQLSPLENALLDSLKKEPELWKHAEGKNPDNDRFLSFSHRERGVVVNSGDFFLGHQTRPTAWSRDLQFWGRFPAEWHALASKIAAERDERDRAVRADAIAADMRKRLGL